jgi:MFS-type transporter involved in bile tolerance (Atg22 family)
MSVIHTVEFLEKWMSKSAAQMRRNGDTTDKGGCMTVLEAPMRQQTKSPQWLWAGIASGPLFVALSFAQVPFHEGFDLTKHAFSFLLLGPGGWLQACNFILAGILYVLSGIGLRRALGRRTGRWAQVLISAVGIGMITAGMFRPDPAYGYPEGAPAGMPAEFTTGSAIHGLAFVVAMLAWCALLVVLAMWLRRGLERRWAAAALTAAVALLAVPAVSAQPFGTVVLYVVVTIAFGITSTLLAHVSSPTRRDR